MSHSKPEVAEMLSPAEVAQVFRVDPKTVTRWAKAGKLTWTKTLGGQRRYYKAEVDALLNGHATDDSDEAHDGPMAVPYAEDGAVILDDDCPHCSKTFRYVFTPVQARAAAARLSAAATRAEVDTRFDREGSAR
jgi:excisionase family DNA binding protein